MTGKGMSCKKVFFYSAISAVCSGIIINSNRLYKQICNVAFFYNNFNQTLAIEMTFIAGCSPAAASFEREYVRMRPFANLTCDY